MYFPDPVLLNKAKPLPFHREMKARETREGGKGMDLIAMKAKKAKAMWSFFNYSCCL
jgi:hypothetical protein